MVEHADILASVHKTVQTSKDLASFLQDEIAKYEDQAVSFELGIGTAHSITTQLRVTANLIDGLIKENTAMMERVNELIDRTTKK